MMSQTISEHRPGSWTLSVFTEGKPGFLPQESPSHPPLQYQQLHHCTAPFVVRSTEPLSYKHSEEVLCNLFITPRTWLKVRVQYKSMG
jgi:hypothetical protein